MNDRRQEVQVREGGAHSESDVLGLLKCGGSWEIEGTVLRETCPEIGLRAGSKAIVGVAGKTWLETMPGVHSGGRGGYAQKMSRQVSQPAGLAAK